MEGSEPVPACIVLSSLTGQFIESVDIQINIQEQNTDVVNMVTVPVRFTVENVGENVACLDLPSEDDIILEGNQVYDLSANAFTSVESDIVTFSRGGDRAVYVLMDDDGTFCGDTLKLNVVKIARQ